VSLDPAIDAFEASLYSTNPVSLLLTAEAAGRAADPSIAPRVAAMAVVTSLGFMLANYSSAVQQMLIELALTRLADLRPLTNGPSVTQPAGNFYSWHY
jgi:hypothetical protein